MEHPKCKYKNEETQMDLAKYENPDVGIESHGFFTIFGNFDYLDGVVQGWGIIINEEFIRKFINVFDVEAISECTGHIWVEHSHNKIFRILSPDGKREFDVEKWRKETEKNVATK